MIVTNLDCNFYFSNTTTWIATSKWFQNTIGGSICILFFSSSLQPF